MTEEQDEPLDESDLHQDVADADRDKVEEPHGPMPATTPQEQRNDEEGQYREHGDNQHHSEHSDAEIHLPIDAALKRILAEHLAQLEREEKEGSVVAYRSDVIGIIARESSRVVLRDQLRERIALR